MKIGSTLGNNKEGKSEAPDLDCNICLEASSEPVATTCGHIFCWPCIYKWLNSDASNKMCPLCKNIITKEKIIPLYTKNNTHNQRRSEGNIPKRPQAEREESKEDRNGFRFGFDNEFLNSFFPGFNIEATSSSVRTNLRTLVLILIMFLSVLFLEYLFPSFDYSVFELDSLQEIMTSNKIPKNKAYKKTLEEMKVLMGEFHSLCFKFLIILFLFFVFCMYVRRIRLM